MGEGIARVRVDGTERRLTSGEVIGVAGIDAIEVAQRRWGYDSLGSDTADDAGEVAPQLQADHQAPVGVGEKGQVGDSDGGRRGGLLDPPRLTHLLAGHRLVEAPGVAVGDDAVGDFDAVLDPSRHRTGGAEIDVIGMGGDDQDPLDRLAVEGQLGHGPDASRCLASGRSRIEPYPRPRAPIGDGAGRYR